MPSAPEPFHKFVGQTKVVRELRNYINAALIESRPIYPILLKGISGLGKSTLSKAIASEVGTSVISFHASESSQVLVEKLLQLEMNDVFFVDEAQELTAADQILLRDILTTPPE